LNFGRGRADEDTVPELWDENLFYVRAFHDLSGSRSSGFGAGPIPVSEVAAYAAAMDCMDVFESLLTRIRAADDAFLAWCKANPQARDDAAGEDRVDADAAKFGLIRE
jgi:hypothetical protein